jgi:hypothetical protein
VSRSTTELDSAVDGGTDSPRPGRLRVFALAFLGLLALLLVRNRALLSVVVNETGDSAANSIITGQAKHFHLLVGNYSRLGFSHPGPAYFYVQALGEWLCHDLFGIVPSPWNGQALAVLALNSAFVAATVTVLTGWARSWVPVALVVGVVLGYFAVHGDVVAVVWMPLMYVTPFLLLLTASASVAAGRIGDLWAVGLAGGFLVHGHAEFLFFVPVIAGAALVVAWRRERGALIRQHRNALILLAVIAVFALPMVVNLVLHWPGEFAKYTGYGSSNRAGGHTPLQAIGYALRFWPGGWAAAPTAVALFGAVVLLDRGLPRTRLLRASETQTRLLAAGAAVAGLATLLFVGYAARGIDDLHRDYVGYFSRAVPLLLMALLALGLGNLVEPGRVAYTLAGAATAAATVTAALSPTLVTPRETIDDLPRVVDALSARSAGRSVVLDVRHNAWPELDALIVAGTRRGMRICARDPSWRFMVTAEFVCSARDLDTGVPFRLQMPPADGIMVGRAVLTAQPEA